MTEPMAANTMPASLINTSGSHKRGRGCFADGSNHLLFFPSHSAPPTNAAVKFRSAQSVGSPREKHDPDNSEFKEVFTVQQLHGAEDVLMAPECNAWGFSFFFFFFSTSTGNAPLTCEPPAAREQEKEVQLPLTHGCLDIDSMYRSWQRCQV